MKRTPLLLMCSYIMKEVVNSNEIIICLLYFYPPLQSWEYICMLLKVICSILVQIPWYVRHPVVSSSLCI